MKIIIGSARRDENGKYSGGKPGDSLQTSTPDTAGEVSLQNFYNHSKGWYVLRPKDATFAVNLADAMTRACNNRHIGYSQSDRTAIIKAGVDTKSDTNCDCSSLVRACIHYACGKLVENFTTYNERTVLSASGLFEKAVVYEDGFELFTGDVLVTRTKGHTAIVCSGNARLTENVSYYKKYTGPSISLVDGLAAIGVNDLSLTHRKKIAAANGIKCYTGTAVQNTQLYNLLRAGKLKKG